MESKQQVFMKFYESLLAMNVLLVSAIASLIYHKEFGWAIVAGIFWEVLLGLICVIGKYIVKLGEETVEKEEL